MAERESKKQDEDNNSNMKIGLTLLQVQELWFLFQQIHRRLEDEKESWVNKLSGDRVYLYMLIEEFRFLKDVTDRYSARVDAMEANTKAFVEKTETRFAQVDRDMVQIKATTAKHEAVLAEQKAVLKEQSADLEEQKAVLARMKPRFVQLVESNHEKDAEILRLQAEVKKLLQERHHRNSSSNNKKRKAEDGEDRNPSLLKAARQALAGLFGLNSDDES